MTQRSVTPIGMSRQEALNLPVSADAEITAKALGVHRRTLYNQVKDGTSPIPALHIGRCLRFRRVDILAYLGIPEDE